MTGHIPSTRQERRLLARENDAHPDQMTLLPPESWQQIMAASSNASVKRFAIWRSKRFLVQGYEEADGVIRLSVNRSELEPSGKWKDGISWDDLQMIKSECGYGARFAVEIYPADVDAVTAANMRHLWILPTPLSIGWRA